MPYIHTLAELRARRATGGTRTAVVGLDGFVDTIVTPVGLRRGPGEDFTAIATIADFGRRILESAGKSTNLELHPRMEKLGGNGPIMAGALLASGTQLTCIGALGRPQVHPVFAELAARARVVSLCHPALTTAVEFTDGKVMLGQMRSLDEVTYERICAVMGEEELVAAVAAADLIALLNWTMVPHMTAIYTAFADRVLPRLPERNRRFFFDLADPEKRSADDLITALAAISRFEVSGRVTLGLNLKEAQAVCRALHLPSMGEDADAVRQGAGSVRLKLGLDTVVVHLPAAAACATDLGTFWLPGPYASRPLITTGAGDHFNAGFATGQLLGLTPEACLGLGVCTSGHYVRTARSPSLDDLETFLANGR
ncbi:MAG: PfkB family carbohydrate kinase [Pseudomonadota bacterium]